MTFLGNLYKVTNFIRLNDNLVRLITTLYAIIVTLNRLYKVLAYDPNYLYYY